MKRDLRVPLKISELNESGGRLPRPLKGLSNNLWATWPPGPAARLPPSLATRDDPFSFDSGPAMRAAQRLNEPAEAPKPEAAIGAPMAVDPAVARPEPASASSSLAPPADSGLAALAMVAGYYRIAADPAQLRHELALGPHAAGPEDLVRAAKRLHLKARLLTGKHAKRLDAAPYPALLALAAGGFAILAAAPVKGSVRLIDPLSRTARDLPLEEATALAGGALVLVTRRFAGAGADPVAFGLSLVSAFDRSLSEAARRGRDRVAFRPGVRAGDADLLPAHRRQGAGPQELRDADGHRRRHAGASVCSTRCCSSCARIPSVTPPTASTSNSAGGCFTTSSACRSPISRRARPARRWRGCASWRRSAAS